MKKQVLKDFKDSLKNGEHIQLNELTYPGVLHAFYREYRGKGMKEIISSMIEGLGSGKANEEFMSTLPKAFRRFIGLERKFKLQNEIKARYHFINKRHIEGLEELLEHESPEVKKCAKDCIEAIRFEYRQGPGERIHRF